MTTRARAVVAVLAALIAAASAGVVIASRQLEPRLRQWVTSSLGESMQSEVELAGVRLSWIPLRLHADGLTLRHRGRTDVPPLLVVKSFSVDLRPADLWSSTVDHVKVDGLEINIPPKDQATGKRPLPDLPPGDAGGDDSSGLVVRRLTATNARLAIVPRDPRKNPRVWDIFELDMENLRAGAPAAFTAALVNPVPYGTIEAKGTFGPWHSDEPAASPITGEYTFAADLGTIEGLAGHLNAVGSMSGTLDRIATSGETNTAGFRLAELDGASLPLHTSYEAVVDGTKGDVELHRVDVDLGKSRFQARGVVEGTKGLKGKRIVLNVKSGGADLAELLRFVSKNARPPAAGRVILDTAFDLPQGREPVLSRLALDGSVRAEQVTFTSSGVQAKINELSRRAQGRPADSSIDDVASRMAARFSLRDGLFTYQGLSFDVTGATVRLAGTHSLRSKAVDLAGEVLLSATVSQTQTGFRSWLLKPFDPLFRKNGAGTRLAIRVEGTQDQPRVGLEIGKTLRGQ